MLLLRILLFISFFIVSISSSAQVGINTNTPKGTLDVQSINNTGLVLPRVASVEVVTDGNSNLPLNGTTVYDISRSTTCFYQNDEWVCIGRDSTGNPILNVVSTAPACVINPTVDYLKASNARSSLGFGSSMSISDDGNTLAVSAYRDSSCSTGTTGGNETDTACPFSGAVYIFTRVSGTWSQQAYLKASNTASNYQFGFSIDLSGDGNTLVVGSDFESSCSTTIDANQNDTACNRAGAAYIFRRTGASWNQQSYIKASNTQANDNFGNSVSLSYDGNKLAVGAYTEDSCRVSGNTDPSNNSCSASGSVYIFEFNTVWVQTSFLKASTVGANDGFGDVVRLSNDGNTIAITAYAEDSCAVGINGDESLNNCAQSGAVYVFAYNLGSWTQQAYLKASNTQAYQYFGREISLSGDGNALAIGAQGESSCGSGVNGSQTVMGCTNTGAVFIWARNGSTWSQEAYLKSSNPDDNDQFGRSLSIAADGLSLIVSSYNEDSCTVAINGIETDNNCANAGASYLFKKMAGSWEQKGYLKAPNAEQGDGFGFGSVISGNGKTIGINAFNETSCASGINGDMSNNSCPLSGATYVFTTN